MADKNFLTDIIDADLAEGKISEIHTRFPPEPTRQAEISYAVFCLKKKNILKIPTAKHGVPISTLSKNLESI